MFPKKLQQKLEVRNESNSLRELGTYNNLVDFSSNDYLGFSKSKNIYRKTHEFIIENEVTQNGATGSRLLSGSHKLYKVLENTLCAFHNSDAALVYNSGYDANLGLFSCVPQRGDIIFYDEHIHASVRDGIIMSNAKSYKFKHNDLKDLERILKQVEKDLEIYVATESIFSMNGDSPDLVALSNLSKTYNAHLIVDEAHAVGVFGKDGRGLLQELGIEKDVFARIVTFGKAIGSHGAVVLGSELLKKYLVNFSRSFIYTTALSPHSIATTLLAYETLRTTKKRDKLKQNIQFFKTKIKELDLQKWFTDNDSTVHCCIISGNDKVKKIAKKFQEEGFDVKPILSPTVPENHERLRFCIHVFNSEEEMTTVLSLLKTYI